MHTKSWKWWMSASLVSLLAACGGSTTEPNIPEFGPKDPQPIPVAGQSDFVSADGQNGEASQSEEDGANNGATADAGAEADDSNRTVEEGDIYQVMSDSGLILNLNSFRGLQIIDFSDVSDPKVIGNVPVTGTPVEMYQVGDRVFILMNNWRGYWGSRDDIDLQTFEGGLVLAVDVSDPTNPQVTGQATIPGYVQRSRLTRGGGNEALYVVTSDWQTGSTVVKSFKVSQTGTLAAKTELDLGGYVSDIQASPDLLMVARWDWSRDNSGSDLTVIDISDPNGNMVEGDTITVNGRIAKKSDMDHRGDILRVVSGNDWANQTNTNHVQTFDATDIHNLTAIDAETFGDGESLFATLFMEDRAFFVTYQQVDPFHAFSVGPDGELEERSEFIISGWNDWFRPVEANTRLVGIGYNDQNGTRALAVSLYNIEDLDNPTPLVQRQTMNQSWGWSEATWDDRAFSVLEKATSVTSPNGDLETGLVLLPFSGWNSAQDKYESGVQIFTFSDESITARGVMHQDTQVRRSFVADGSDSTTANLSEAELSLFDTTDPDAPAELSRLELAPNYSDFLIFGDHGIRRRDNHAYYWWRVNTQDPTDTLQVVSLTGDVDRDTPLAEIDVPTNSQLYKVGDLLVAATSDYLGYTNNQPDVETTLEVWDLSDPTNPVAKGTLTTDELPPQYGYYNYWGYDDVAVAGLDYYFYGGNQTVRTVEDGLVFTAGEQQQVLEGTVTRRWMYPKEDQQRWENCYDQQTYEPKECSYIDGGINCSQLTRPDGTVEPEVCQGSFRSCTQDATGDTDCEETTLTDDQIVENEYTNDQFRYWQSYDFHTVDLSNPDAPALGQVLDGGTQNESVDLLAKDGKLFYSYKRPYTLPNDARPFVKYFFRQIDVTDVATPTAGPEINVPGQLLEVDGDTVITRDFLWGENIVESSVNKLELANNRAYLRGVNRFEDRQVSAIQLDGAGNVLVSHQVAWLVNYESNGYGGWDDWDRTVSLSVLDLDSPQFEELAQVEIDDWASLTGAIPGKALFQVPGGMLVVNVTNPAQTHAQAYFPLRGWPRGLQTNGDDVYFAAGPFGLYTFDSNVYNLSTP